MSIKTVNALSHYTDWTIGHVHSGALGWVALMTMASLYSLTPRLWGKSGMYSTQLINVHFWIATIGIVLYISSMWIAGVLQGLMWREVDANGFLVNSFTDTVEAKFLMYVVRGLGGVLYLAGGAVMVWNMWMTIRAPQARPVTVALPAE